MAGRGEEYEKEEGAVNAWSVKKVGAHEEEEDKYGRRVGGNE